ncbi:hypothetical protein CRENPOLYSF1_50105 [Crenothrix polyspora]|uniref:Uncharacterized protein n=1 Tax=Crenothrix polyspora TaxID=360316 RepID=A0A1R4HCX5_9GAMM|nr:hypothetical protein CRENPOLYSF1_50105 [Crenothrix polyspora]
MYIFFTYHILFDIILFKIKYIFSFLYFITDYYVIISSKKT